VRAVVIFAPEILKKFFLIYGLFLEDHSPFTEDFSKAIRFTHEKSKKSVPARSYSGLFNRCQIPVKPAPYRDQSSQLGTEEPGCEKLAQRRVREHEQRVEHGISPE
jgi:hypothetical protein